MGKNHKCIQFKGSDYSLPPSFKSSSSVTVFKQDG